MNSRVKYSLLVFRGEETIGEYSYSVPYGDSVASLDPLRKLKPELYGAILGQFGITAVSSNMPQTHPMYRSGAIQVERAS